MDKINFFSEKRDKQIETQVIELTDCDAYGVVMSGWNNGGWSKDSGWIHALGQDCNNTD